MKKATIEQKIISLMMFLESKTEAYMAGEIDEEHFYLACKFADQQMAEIEAEMAVKELLESICLN